MKTQVIIAFLFSTYFSINCIAQKSNNIWLVGRNTYTGNNVNQITFSKNGIVNIDTVPHHGLLFEANSSYCDPVTGELLLYTDGFHLFDGDYQLVEGGDSLSPSENRNNYYALEEKLGYYWGNNIPNSVVILPLGKGKLGIVHENGRSYGITDSLFYSEVKVVSKSEITEGLSNEIKVLKKNIVIRDDEDGYSGEAGSMVAIRHANGRDWWIIIGHARFPPTATSEYKYYVFYLDTTGMYFHHEELIARSSSYANNVWSLMPSKDGTMLASGVSSYNPSENMFDRDSTFMHVYNFDRCTGQIQRREGEVLLYSDGFVNAPVFSPNGEYLYAITFTKIIQFPVQEDNWYLKGDTVGRWSQAIDDEDGVPRFSLFGNSRIGPDGKIYISASHDLTKYMHVIHYPDKQGAACEFEQNGIPLPLVNKGSIPFYVNYNLGPIDGSPCDTLGIDETTSIIEIKENKVEIEPNPIQSEGLLQLNFAGQFTGQINLYSNEGELKKVQEYSRQKHIEYRLPRLTPGVYYLNFVSERRRISKKIIVQ